MVSQPQSSTVLQHGYGDTAFGVQQLSSASPLQMLSLNLELAIHSLIPQHHQQSAATTLQPITKAACKNLTPCFVYPSSALDRALSYSTDTEVYRIIHNTEGKSSPKPMRASHLFRLHQIIVSSHILPTWVRMRGRCNSKPLIPDAY